MRKSKGAKDKQPRIDFSKLLGFEMISDQVSHVLDFQDETIDDKLGAKIGPIEPGKPSDNVDKPS